MWTSAQYEVLLKGRCCSISMLEPHRYKAVDGYACQDLRQRWKQQVRGRSFRIGGHDEATLNVA